MIQDILDEEPTPSPKIIQILIAPNDVNWQGTLIGLGDDGVTYHAGTEWVWEPLISPICSQENEKEL